jgi:SAM-dependent methyltransferase
MRFAHPTSNVIDTYKYAANAQYSWNRSRWSTKENQENGFYQIASLLTEFPDIHSVLDVGCGDGRIQQFLPEQITDYTGIDITPEIVSVANKPYILHADIKNFFPARTYDAVFAIGSFNIAVPTEDVVAALTRMHEISNIVTICNISYLSEEDPALFEQLGFKVIKHPYSFCLGYADQYTLIKTH